MKAISYSVSQDNLDKKLEELEAFGPSVIVMFFAPDQVHEDSIMHKVNNKFGNINVVGCSTSGEITDEGLSESSLSLIALKFDTSKVQVAGEVINGLNGSKPAANVVGEKLKGDDLKGIMLLAPGLNVNGTEISHGVSEKVPEDVVVFGGLAGDNANFACTYTFINGELSENKLIGVGFYGSNVNISASSRGGWSSFGPVRNVTKVNGNVLYEIDGKPALDLYKEYLGDKVEGLPASGLLYPFAILDGDQKETGIVRTILNVSEEDKSLTLAGDMSIGNAICLMHADVDALIDGAELAANDVAFDDNEKDSAAFLVSCVGRKIVMEDEVEEEIDVVKDVLGSKAVLAGFYSYGEIAPKANSKKAELHNQTMTITHICENM